MYIFFSFDGQLNIALSLILSLVYIVVQKGQICNLVNALVLAVHERHRLCVTAAIIGW